MVKSSVLVALVSILARTLAQDDSDDCYWPDEEETTSAAVVTSTSSTPITSTCPQLPPPTTTDSITLLTAVATVSEVTPATTTVYIATVTSTAPQPTDQTDVSFFTETKAEATETIYTGSVFTSVTFEIVPAATTVTIPRRADFTPVKCESAYVGPFLTSTISYTSTVSTYSYVSTFTSDSTSTFLVIPTPLIFPSVTISGSTTTITLQTTTTVTSTRDDPTSTVYAACQGTDNVTPDAPPSYYQYVGQPVVVPGTYSSIVAAIDQVDCCALCQANEQCTASSFYTKPIFGVRLDTYLVRTACQLFLKNDTASTCDPSFIGATMSFDYPEIINYYSNGPCGQFNFSSVYDRPRFIRAP